ncbi:MAG: PadR family transcriptional regulator [Gemmatimonadota bacterium]|nr:PadR family transcriptional regulator [Gemmatimonadota bacterium]
MLTIEPMSGYDMKKFSEQSLAHFWHESYGNLYPRLKRLAGAGLIRGRRESRTRAPDAIVYSLTSAGREAFLEWLDEAPEPERPRSELVLKMFFGAHSSRDRLARLMDERRRDLEETRDRYAEIEAMLREGLEDRPEVPFWLITLRRGQLLTEARLRWCEECATWLDRPRAEPPR